MKVEGHLSKEITSDALKKRANELSERIEQEAEKATGIGNGTIKKISRAFDDLSFFSDIYGYGFDVAYDLNMLDEFRKVISAGSAPDTKSEDECSVKVNQVFDFLQEVLDTGAYKDKNLSKVYSEFTKKRAESLDEKTIQAIKEEIAKEETNQKKQNVENEKKSTNFEELKNESNEAKLKEEQSANTDIEATRRKMVDKLVKSGWLKNNKKSKQNEKEKPNPEGKKESEINEKTNPEVENKAAENENQNKEAGKKTDENIIQPSKEEKKVDENINQQSKEEKKTDENINQLPKEEKQPDKKEEIHDQPVHWQQEDFKKLYFKNKKEREEKKKERDKALGEALMDFSAISGRSLGWKMKGDNAETFGNIRDAVDEYDNPIVSRASEEEKREKLYRACDKYLRAHTADGKTIDGQNTKVGRLRKQAVLGLIQALEEYPDIRKVKAQMEQQAAGKDGKGSARVKLDFKELEKSLADASKSKIKLSKSEKKDPKAIKNKAYSELKKERNEAGFGNFSK